ncbi:hypothetical protein EYC84_009974 [Monilinia fructicola]|uniref:Vacuolar protein sorting-associated protein 35 n=1 Tax=Monilinia fructicola TaxID=38448 RepID=A0A5M9JIC9_MONFR|nr:hypothetical protein EYC84_009974 [Monilinia fructicola]
MASPPQVVEDQARLLEDALNVVRQQTQLMRRCLESPGKLMDALKCSSTLVSELRTSSLGPKTLWVRLQHQGHSREREMRTQERKELQLLVGSNLVRLSQLVDLDVYKNTILQPLLEQVVQCRDVLAQEYLLEVITQVFPDEYHLHTLDQFLAAVSRLNPHVNMKVIVIAMMDRLSAYAARESESSSGVDREKSEQEAVTKLLEATRLNKESKAVDSQPESTPVPESSESNGNPSSTETNGASSDAKPKEENEDSLSVAPTEVETQSTAETVNKDVTNDKPNAVPDSIKLYEIFFDQVMHLVASQRLSVQDTLALLVSLVNLALKVHPDRLDYVDQVLDYASDRKNILNLLLTPITSYASIFTALSLPTYIPLLQLQIYPTRRAVAGEVARTLQSNSTKISTVASLEGVLEVLKVLIKEGSQNPANYAGVQRKSLETEETIEEQGWLSRIVHLIHSDDNDTQFKLLQITKAAYSEGNERAREHYDDNWESQISALFKFMHSTLSTMYTRVSGSAEHCLRLFVACGQIADQTNFEEVSYEFFAQAFTIYEESISDSRAQFQAVCVIASALHETRNFNKENYDTLITKCALHGSKLLKKPDQCRAVFLASHLWWAVPIAARGETDEKNLYRDGKRVLECLQRALRVADACMDTAVSVELFVEILNRYVYYFEQENEAVTTKYLNGLIELIHSNLQGNQDSATITEPRKHFERTLENITSRNYEGVVTAAAP